MNWIAGACVKSENHENVSDCAGYVRAANDDGFAGGRDRIVHASSAANKAHGVHELAVLIALLNCAFNADVNILGDNGS